MRVGFFVTCLVDLLRPAIGFAAIRLLKSGGADVYVPPRRPVADNRRTTPAIARTLSRSRARSSRNLRDAIIWLRHPGRVAA
jgi:hypothetical protein